MITELTAEEYRALDVRPEHCYNSAVFTELNAEKVDAVHYLAWFEEGKLRATLILGEDAATLRSPFSAPFGGFNCVREPSDVLVEMIFDDLRSYASEKGKRLRITFPPEFYSTSVSAFVIRAVNTPWIEVVSDYNYYYPTAGADEYESALSKDERKKLRRAVKAGYDFRMVTDEAEKREVYEVIRRNRESQGYPLRMTLGQVMATEAAVKIDFFMMRDPEGNPVAAAICYHVSPGVVQVIYWGDLLEFRDSHPMNLLAMEVFRHYRETGVAIVDVGPSSTDGIPNRGLCTFKHRVGCRLCGRVSISL